MCYKCIVLYVSCQTFFVLLQSNFLLCYKAIFFFFHSKSNGSDVQYFISIHILFIYVLSSIFVCVVLSYCSCLCMMIIKHDFSRCSK